MGEKSGQIESEYIKKSIDVQRGNLGRDIQELENKVRTSVDWRLQFQKNPMTMIGIAFGGGVLFSALLGNRQRSRYGRPYSWEPDAPSRSNYGDVSSREYERSPGANYQKQRALDTWDSIKGALIGVAASKFRSFLDQAVPGFAEQYQKTERAKTRADSTAINKPSPLVPAE